MSPHFSLAELTRTDTRLPNVPTEEAKANLERLAETVLEPARELLSCPIVVHSGYRCHAVNMRVGGSARSAHLEGRACDFHPLIAPIKDAFNRIVKSNIPYDKLILEHKGQSWWIHVQVAKVGREPRRKSYWSMPDPIDGIMEYVEVDHV